MNGRQILPGVAGDRFGRLIILKRGRYSLCRCDCGTEKLIKHSHLTRRVGTRSCGCWRVEFNRASHTTHGESNRTAEYRIWKGMITRCDNPKRGCYQSYGGRGISVSGEWRSSYAAFLRDVGRRPSPKHSLERVDNGGNYEAGNVRWATHREQMHNTRANRFLEFNGDRLIVTDWAEKVGIPKSVLFHRLYHGWTVERALTQRVRGSL